MHTFFQELAKKLAERWLGLLVLPAALLLVVAVFGVQLGHPHALDWSRARHLAATAAGLFSQQPAGTQALLAVALLLATSGIGLSTQALAALTRTLWLGQWPRAVAVLQRWRIRRRRTRWHRRLARRRELEQAHPRDSRTPDQQQRINDAAEKVNRLALAEPGRPTWMGDRIHATERVALDRYGLDLPFTWPRLWLLLPDTTRGEITAAHAGFASAVATGTWAWPYLALAAFWWPAALVAVAVGIVGWTRARSAVDDLNALTESALDLHTRALGIELGVADLETIGPLDISEGRELTAIVRKGR